MQHRQQTRQATRPGPSHRDVQCEVALLSRGTAFARSIRAQVRSRTRVMMREDIPGAPAALDSHQGYGYGQNTTPVGCDDPYEDDDEDDDDDRDSHSQVGSNASPVPGMTDRTRLLVMESMRTTGAGRRRLGVRTLSKPLPRRDPDLAQMQRNKSYRHLRPSVRGTVGALT